MKYFLLPAAAVVLLPACGEKPAEPAAAIVPAPAPKTSPDPSKNKLRPPPPVPGAATNPAIPAPPPLSREDLNDLNADYETLADQVEQHKSPPDGAEDTAFAAFQDTYKVLNARRSTLLTGRTLNDKREIARTTSAAVQRIEQSLKRHLLERARSVVPHEEAEAAELPETDEQGVPRQLLDPASDGTGVEPPPPPGGFVPPADPGAALPLPPQPVPLPPPPVPVPQDPEHLGEPEPAPEPEDEQPADPQP